MFLMGNLIRKFHYHSVSFFIALHIIALDKTNVPLSSAFIKIVFVRKNNNKTLMKCLLK